MRRCVSWRVRVCLGPRPATGGANSTSGRNGRPESYPIWWPSGHTVVERRAKIFETMNTKTKMLEEALAEIPVLDIHTHLVGGRLGARGLHDVLLYHMVVSDLYAAGCPTGAR